MKIIKQPLDPILVFIRTVLCCWREIDHCTRHVKGISTLLPRVELLLGAFNEVRAKELAARLVLMMDTNSKKTNENAIHSRCFVIITSNVRLSFSFILNQVMFAQGL